MPFGASVGSRWPRCLREYSWPDLANSAPPFPKLTVKGVLLPTCSVPRRVNEVKLAQNALSAIHLSHLNHGGDEVYPLAVHQSAHDDHVDGALGEARGRVRCELGRVDRVGDGRDLFGGQRSADYEVLPAGVAHADGVVDAAHGELHELVQVDAGWWVVMEKWREINWEGVGEGRTRLLLVLVVGPFAANPFRDKCCLYSK